VKIDVQVATDRDMEDLWKLNHEVYCRELGQHRLETSGRRIDKMYSTAIYFAARADGIFAGMLSATPPGSGSISTLKRIPHENGVHREALLTTEVRLLAVARKFRGRGVYDHLIFALMKYCSENSIHRILISAVERQVRLYELMGFTTISGVVEENGCRLQPMLLLRSSFEKSPYRLRVLARMEGR
jgi:GNAT superfamily N-acetyltransferase